MCIYIYIYAKSRIAVVAAVAVGNRYHGCACIPCCALNVEVRVWNALKLRVSYTYRGCGPELPLEDSRATYILSASSVAVQKLV